MGSLKQAALRPICINPWKSHWPARLQNLIYEKSANQKYQNQKYENSISATAYTGYVHSIC